MSATQWGDLTAQSPPFRAAGGARPGRRGSWWVAKRAFDVAFSLAALAFLAPLWALIAAAVRLGDSGPVFYRQERVGLGGRPFTLLKFRTMAVGADALVDGLIAERACAAVFFKVPGDQRVTRVGRVLRRWSLDETPQFWNVLRGEMSVVGPRPQVAREVAEYAPEHFKRLDVRPGITGLWQVSGRNSLTVAESLRLDLEYVCGFGPLADLRVLVRTVPAIARSAAEDW